MGWLLEESVAELLQLRQAVGRALVLGERPTSVLEVTLGHERAVRASDQDGLGLAYRPALSPAVPPKRRVRRHPPILDVCKHAERPGRMQTVTNLQEQPQTLLKVADAARLLRVSPWTVYRRAADGSLPSLRIGQAGPLRFTADAVETLLRPALAHALETKETT